MAITSPLVYLQVHHHLLTLTIRVVAKRDEGKQHTEDDIGLHQLVVVQLPKILHHGNPPLVELGEKGLHAESDVLQHSIHHLDHCLLLR